MAQIIASQARPGYSTPRAPSRGGWKPLRHGGEALVLYRINLPLEDLRAWPDGETVRFEF
jgi:hypothetical protein